jgi:hypothetical protein
MRNLAPSGRIYHLEQTLKVSVICENKRMFQVGKRYHVSINDDQSFIKEIDQ